MTLRGLVLDAVLRLGECRAADVAAEVGAQIPAAQAATAGRKRRRNTAKYTKSERRSRRLHTLESLGKIRLVSENLYRLLRCGKIRRVRRGMYAPNLPKLFGQSRTA